MNPTDEIYSRAIRLLARREYSVWELRNKLSSRKGFGRRRAKARHPKQTDTPDVDQAGLDVGSLDVGDRADDAEDITSALDAVINRLREDDLVSDERFVESFVRSRVNRGHGPMKIRSALRERGIDDAMTDEHLTYDDEFWLDHARTIERKRFGVDEVANVGEEGEPGEVDEAESVDRPAVQQMKSWEQRARFLASRGFPSDIIYRSLGPRSR